ncbi:ATP/GTP-binding protein, partial [Corynebacterium bovis]
MGIANFFKGTSSAGDDERFRELYQDILQGTAEAPRWYEDDGLAFARWKARNRQVTDRMERIHRAEQGIAPVAFEETFSAPGRRGYAACGGGFTRAVGEVRRYQTATSLNAGFQPNVVGAPAPMIGAPLGRHVVTGVDVGFDALSWFA